MRRIFNFTVTTLDGYHTGPNEEFDWPVVDDEFNEFAVAQLNEVDTLVFGRTTYEGMAAYWPTPTAEQNDPVVAGRMNDIDKIVVSRSLGAAAWSNTRLVTDLDELAQFKQRPGKDIAIFGSSELTVSLLDRGLVDELRIMINPVLLGAGRSVFGTATHRTALRLTHCRQFTSGNVLLRYQPTGRTGS